MTLLDSLLPLQLFPVNGLDRSLHAPVLVGLLVLTLFAELYGWTYAGLVVPGYLAAVFVSAPVTGALICVEALLTYLLCEVCGRWLPRWGVWSTTFGRERFFLFIVNAVLVRLAVEGLIVPWLGERYEFAHSRELYSLGLVLVPLVANAFWNAGFLVSAPRVAIATGLTYAVVAWVLLPYTNFTTSRFEIANESVSLAFLESPHAHIILLTGALLGARNNVRYGWDYNGILVPALLAVAWYQPTKLATTVVEALIVYWASMAITKHGPLSRVLIVGSRRVFVTYVVGFVMKLAMGFTLQQVDRSVQMVDYFGFGYLLPTLLAVKMWNKDKIGPVIMPTLQVSIVAFFVGNALGFGLTTLDDKLSALSPREAPPGLVETSAARALMLADTAPAPRATRHALASTQIALHLARAAQTGPIEDRLLERAARAGLGVARDSLSSGASAPSEEWIVVGPRAQDPNDDRLAPRFAVRRASERVEPWLIVVTAEQPGSAAIVMALELATLLQARAVVVRSRLAEVQSYDDAFVGSLARGLDLTRILRLQLGAATARLSVVGGLPSGLDLAGLGELLHMPIELSWRAAVSDDFPLYANAPLLELPSAPIEERAAALLRAPEIETWAKGAVAESTARASELTDAGDAGYRPPSIEELRLFARQVAPAALGWTHGAQPTPWQRAVAGLLGYRIARVGDPSSPPVGWALFEPKGPARRGNATWILSAAATTSNGTRSARLGGKLMVAAPVPRLESGTFSATASLTSGLNASAWILFGALPAELGTPDTRRADMIRSFYQQAQEAWLNAGGRVVAVHGATSERPLPGDVLLSHGFETRSAADTAHWVQPLRSLLELNGLRLLTFDGSAETAAFKGSSDPLMAYAARFAEGGAALLWLTPELRQRIRRVRDEPTTTERLKRLGTEPAPVELPSFALDLAACTAPARQGTPTKPPSDAAGDFCLPARASAPPTCDPEEAATLLQAYASEKNPYLLRSVTSQRSPCRPLWIEDRATGLLWGAISRAGRAWLVPLEGEIDGSTPWLTTGEQVRQATALGLVGVRVQAEGPLP